MDADRDDEMKKELIIPCGALRTTQSEALKRKKKGQ